ncbi:MAG: phosphoribosyltransferase [Armatimonadota bacterium]|jgi:putative phosphoribosyl transferase
MSETDHCPDGVVEMPQLRDRVGVFEDRADAGRTLAALMGPLRGTGALVLAIPAGGVPVAAPLAEELGLELDVAVVSKITLPWNTEAGYGAVAFDGTVRINEPLRRRLGLSREDVEAGIEITRGKVERRVRELRGERRLPDVTGRSVVLCDDGLASGFTMLTAVEAVRNAGPERVIVAIPTAHRQSLERIIDDVDCVYCCNVRGGMGFAVAAAYRHWRDVPLAEARTLLERHGRNADEG